MNNMLKKWAKSATVIPPANRPVGLERHPVKTSITTSTLASIPTKAIRRISRTAPPSRHCTSGEQSRRLLSQRLDD